MAKVAFLVSRISVETGVRCGGKHDKGFIANFVLNPIVNNFENRSTYAGVMHKCIGVMFFDSQCTQQWRHICSINVKNTRKLYDTWTNTTLFIKKTNKSRTFIQKCEPLTVYLLQWRYRDTDVKQLSIAKNSWVLNWCFFTRVVDKLSHRGANCVVKFTM